MKKPEMNMCIVVRYLKNITQKLILVTEKLEALENKVVILGRANSEAYGRTKKVISELAENQKCVEMDLADAAGTIREATWC